MASINVGDVKSVLGKVFVGGKLDMAKAKELGVAKLLKDGMSVYDVEKILKKNASAGKV